MNALFAEQWCRRRDKDSVTQLFHEPALFLTYGLYTVPGGAGVRYQELLLRRCFATDPQAQHLRSKRPDSPYGSELHVHTHAADKFSLLAVGHFSGQPCA